MPPPLPPGSAAYEGVYCIDYEQELSFLCSSDMDLCPATSYV